MICEPTFASLVLKKIADLKSIHPFGLRPREVARGFSLSGTGGKASFEPRSFTVGRRRDSLFRSKREMLIPFRILFLFVAQFRRPFFPLYANVSLPDPLFRILPCHRMT